MRANDLCHVAVIERLGVSPGVAHGLLRAFGLNRGAVASSVGHDSHNVIVAGLNEADMRVALQAIAAIQGGVASPRADRLSRWCPSPSQG